MHVIRSAQLCPLRFLHFIHASQPDADSSCTTPRPPVPATAATALRAPSNCFVRRPCHFSLMTIECRLFSPDRSAKRRKALVWSNPLNYLPPPENREQHQCQVIWPSISANPSDVQKGRKGCSRARNKRKTALLTNIALFCQKGCHCVRGVLTSRAVIRRAFKVSVLL
jgi:hypothetical protein